MGNSCSHGCRWWCLWWRLFVLSVFPRDVLVEIWDLIEPQFLRVFYLLCTVRLWPLTDFQVRIRIGNACTPCVIGSNAGRISKYSSLWHVSYTHLYQRLVIVSSYYYHILYLGALTQVAGRGSGSSIVVWSRGYKVYSPSNQGVVGRLTLLENLLQNFVFEHMCKVFNVHVAQAKS